MKRIFLLIFLLAFILSAAFAQNKVIEVKINEISGQALGSGVESVDQVVQRAISDAKVKALKKAGVAEKLISFSDYFQSEINLRYEELFTSDILSDIRGSVKDIEVLDTKKTFDQSNQLKVEVLISCTVIKYLTEKDLTFDAWIEGIGKFYPNETNLIFKVKPSKDTYLKVFLFSESEAFQMFPNDYEPSYLLKANTQYNFPSEVMDYELFTENESEVHRMIMVFMKEDIPYTNDVKYEKIIDWIFSIPPDMRVIKSFGFSVVQEDKMKE